MAYNTGTTSSVSAVANARPNMIVIAIGLNIAVPPHSNGVMPNTVVAVVSRIGRKRCWQAVKIASYWVLPNSLISIAMRSSKTIALLMIMPDSEINPSKVKKPNDELAISSPNVTPTKPSGMVERIIGRRSGTGGSSGVDYLDGTAKYRIFTDFWAVRTVLVRPDMRPQIGNPGFYGFTHGS